jgi:hypothetical protein
MTHNKPLFQLLALFNTIVGGISGILLHDLAKTILFAAVGALVSYLVTFTLNRITKKLKL